jgi:hypothetical protein
MRRLFKLFAVSACLLLFACGASTVAYRILDRGVTATGPFASQSFRIISEAPVFTEAFQSLHAAEVPRPTSPEVDFAQSAVLILSLGQQPSAGYQIDVEQIKQQGEVLNVQLRLSKPSSTSVQATVVTSPFIVIQVPKQPSWHTAKFFDQEQKLLVSLEASN